MKSYEFQALCGKYLIDVGVALESEAIQAAIVADDAERVEKVLREEF